MHTLRYMDHVVELSPVGSVAVVALLVAALGAFGFSWSRSRRAFPSSWLLLFRGLAVLLGLFCALLFLAAGSGPGWTPWEAFDQVRWLDAAGLAAGLAVALAAPFEWGARRDGRRRHELDEDSDLDLIGPAVLGPLLAIGALVHGLWLQSLGPMPGMEITDCETVHVGHTCVPRIRVTQLGVTRRKGLFNARRVKVWYLDDGPTEQTSFDDLEGWRIPEAPVHGEVVGEQSIEVVAERPGIRVSTTAGPFRVAQDRGDPRLSVAPGHRWVYQGSTRDSVHVLLFLGSTTVVEDEDPVEVRVGQRREEAGLSVLPISVRMGAEEEELLLAGVDGSWMALDEDRRLRPAFEWEALDPELDYAEGIAGRCSVGWLPGFSCHCSDAALDDRRVLPGPVGCSRSQGSGLGTALLAVFTLGMVIDTPASRHLVLVESGGG